MDFILILYLFAAFGDARTRTHADALVNVELVKIRFA